MELTLPTATLVVPCFVLVAGKVLMRSIQAVSPTFPPHQEADGGQDLGRGHSQDS